MELTVFVTIQPPEHLSRYARRYFFSNQSLEQPFSFEMLPAGSAYIVNYFSNSEIKTVYNIDKVEGKRLTRWNVGGPVLKSKVIVYEP